jgi:hypothetical protein
MTRASKKEPVKKVEVKRSVANKILESTQTKRFDNPAFDDDYHTSEEEEAGYRFNITGLAEEVDKVTSKKKVRRTLFDD